MSLKNINESNLKVVDGFKSISCNFCLGYFDCLHQINDKNIPSSNASLVKFLTMFKKWTMEARFLKVSILAGCLKLEVVAWIVGLSSAIFNNNGQLVPNAFLESLKIFVK